MNGLLNGPGVRDTTLNHGKSATESAAYFWNNITKGVQDTAKGAIVVDSGRRAATGTFKSDKDFARGDALCGGLCCISVGCEAVSSIIIWCPVPSKIAIISCLKSASVGCQKFRDLCAAEPSSPLC